MTDHDLARSVQDRLKNWAQALGRPYEELLIRHALERFLFRFSTTRHRDHFVLKGGLLLPLWTGLEARPTRDIDLLGPVGLEPDGLRNLVEDCMRAPIEADGWDFLGDPKIAINPIRESAAYMGLRAVFLARLGKSRVRMQIDVGTGDSVVPPPVRIAYPTLLGQQAPDLMGYSGMTSIAEKLDAILVLGFVNSRMKDYFDIAFLAEHLEFEGRALARAIFACSQRRGTSLPTTIPDGLSDDFAEDSEARQRWESFVKKTGSEHESGTWQQAVVRCRNFLVKPMEAAATGKDFGASWQAGGPWI